MMKKPECKDIVGVVLPAVRAAVAEEMHKKYGCNQEEIAKRLGVVQVAVSKYLNGKYSSEISQVKKYIEQQKLGEEAVRKAVGSGGRKEVDEAIDALCEKLVAVQTN